MTQETTEYWEQQRDAYARTYENPRKILHYEKRHRLERALDMAELSGTGALVDIGVGAGELFRRLSHHDELVGVDFSREMLRGAVSRHPDASYVQGTVDSLPLRANVASSVFCLGVLGHLDRSQVAPAIAEINRVLEPGGELLISFANSGSPSRMVRSVVSRHLSGSDLDYDTYSPKTVTAHLDDAGFVVDDRKYVTFLPGLLNTSLHLKCYKVLDRFLDESGGFRNFAMTWLLRATKPT